MDENLSRGYVQLNQSGQRRSADRDHDAPRDNYQLVYLGLLLAGVGFLLPYNSFIIACDYFEAKYPLSTIVFDMSLVYILVAFGAVCVNNALVEALAFSRRIAFGYLVSFSTLLFVLLFEVVWDVFSKDIGYTVNLIAVAVVAFGCTGKILTKLLLQNERLNTALFFLISTGLVLACVLTYSRLQSCAFVAYYVRQCSRHGHERGSFVEQCHGGLSAFIGSEADGDHLEGGVRSELLKQDSEDVNLVDTVDEAIIGSTEGPSRAASSGGVLSFRSPLTSPTGPFEATTVTTTNTELQQRFGITDSLDQLDPQQIEEELANYGLAANQIHWLSNNALSLEEGRHRFKVQDVVVKIRGTASTKRRKYWTAIKRGAVARGTVARSVWPYMLSISLAYCVTLCLFPGIESAIISCRLHSWMPVILMAIFNAADFVGKMLASLAYSLERSALVYFSLARVVLVPLMALCALPGPSASALDDAWAMFLSLALGLSNGVLGSVPMIIAPSKVSLHYKELTGTKHTTPQSIQATRLATKPPSPFKFSGNMMTLSYSVGLTTGSLIAYLIQHWLDSQNRGYRGSCDDLRLNRTSPPDLTSLSTTLTSIVNGIAPTALPQPSSNGTTLPSVVTTTALKFLTSTVLSILSNSSRSAGATVTPMSPTTEPATATPFVPVTVVTDFLNGTIA
ncbi:equilibrative nucleoside transporter 4-like [Tropilaelaps mercedesae]|uniref:Equilibrative nucleoside transporter 4-like n=1 Tax=Tropilaelaps mercedesae TaxID=418985 RepID=A0A1V9XCU5_9ACAR|nr:equilibrative nucleoside transporter 4-like [Tropilaelaps mercedesae]